MKIPAFAILLLLVFFRSSTSAQPGREVDDYIKKAMAKYEIPGLSLAVVRDGKLVKLQDYGISSAEFNLPLQKDTVFQLFSTSKIFAGVAIMKLVEDGRLTLDTPVTELIADLPRGWRSVTVRNLLNHTSGLPGVNANPRYASIPKDQLENQKADEFMKYAVDLPLAFEPGDKFSYGQTAYILAGLIVERLTHRSYEDFLKQRIFDPLGMSSTKFGGTSVFIKRRPPTVYNRDNGVLKPWTYPFSPKDFPGAGLNSSAADLAKFLIAIDGGRVLRPSSLRALWAPAKLNNGKEVNYALGWTVEEHEGQKVVGHEGGGSIWVAHFPSVHLSVIVLSNLNGARADEIQYDVADFYLKDSLEKTPAKTDNPAKDLSMARIPGTTFMMGTEASKIGDIAIAYKIEKHPDLITSEAPQHKVTLDTYYIDKYEVTNEQFAGFLKKNPQWSAARVPPRLNNGNYLKDWKGVEFPTEKANFPVVNVSWYAAVAYCQFVGKRLPTEAEWEYAARGGLKNKTFPWGDELPDKSRVNFGGSGIKTTVPVGGYAPNGYGLFDMAGNLWEYTVDEWDSYWPEPQTNPVAGGNLVQDDSFLKITKRRVIRGGSWGGAPLNLRVTYRDSHPPDGSRDFVGFRCAK